MSYINIRVTDTNVTSEQKKLLIEGVTKLIVSVLNEKPETTHVVIDEIQIQNWGFNGKQSLKIKKNHIYIQH
ncbi:tautomerase family protein [Kordia sp.]|uniref:tautomerase family protein n=1 Tax=Kordia sp. TaxID=1965332 RepID=UPI003D2CDC4F